MTRAKSSALVDTRVVWCGDCLEQLRRLPDACVDLVYIDPPFNSNRNYEVFWGETKEKRAFEDRHANTAAYLDYMRPRCVELHRVLKPTGSFYYHCDWHASHYVKVMLDQIFGEDQFQSEIIWKRTFAHGNVGKNYGNIADSVFFYTAGSDYTWNQQFTPLDESYVKKFYRRADPGGRVWRPVTLRNPSIRPNLQYDYTALNGVTYKPHANGWSWSPERMRKADEAGRLVYPRKPTGALLYKQYLDETRGSRLDNIWDDIPPIGAHARERLGYPTQKPLALLERIIQTSSNEGDIVLDAFCGCGTALVAAQKLKRQWIGIDVSPTACRVMAKRLREVCGIQEDEALRRIGRGFVVWDLPWSEEKLRAIPPFEFENWAVIALGGIPNKTKVGDKGIDGRIYPASMVAEPGAPYGTPRAGELDLVETWYPIQVKQKDQAGSPDIRDFAGVLARDKRPKGFFISFDYTDDAMKEVDAQFRATGRVIIPLTVKDILEEQLARKLA